MLFVKCVLFDVSSMVVFVMNLVDLSLLFGRFVSI